MNPYIGEIRMFGGNFAPVGWALCQGQLLPIAQYDTLFNLIGTTYGGNGVTTFALPDLQGRLPVHQGNGFSLGQAGGSETVTLTPGQMPAHTHVVMASSAEAETASPAGALLCASADTPFYAPYNPGKSVAMNAAVVSPAGGSLPHDNMQPFLCVSFIIALEGIYPQQG